MHFPRGRTTPITLAATVMLAVACSDRGPSVPSEPLIAPKPTASFTLTPVTTNWDFVALAGAPDRGLGNPYTFTIAGAGSVVASAAPVAFPTQFLVFSKGSAQAPGTEERGLGLCRQFEPGGDCLGAADDEIGDPWGSGLNPSVFLDFTQLAAGSTVTSVTLASLQPGEGWAVYASTNGSTYTLVSTGTSAGGVQEPTFTIPIPDPATKFLQIAPGPGAFGNNYLVQSVTTVTTPPNVGTQWCSPGYWKNHPGSPPWPAGYQSLLYNSFSGSYAHGPFSFADNPTLLQVISNPKIYHGDATNNVADVISNKVFGTPIGTGVENCPLN